MAPLARLEAAAGRARDEVRAVSLASKHPDVPWYTKWLVFLVAAYAVSPIDIIPDFIPVLGYLDDLIILPAGIYLAIRMIPPEVMEECRARVRADRRPPEEKEHGAAESASRAAGEEGREQKPPPRA